jgi:quercetin dioxygenase-like cupin family protein
MHQPEIITIASDDNNMTTPEEGLRRQVMSYSPSMMLVRHTMQKGWVGVRHSHPHEQMVYVIRGHIVFEHPAGRFEAGTGESFLVPGGVEHQASALENSEVLDIFTPYREDYAPKAS